MQTLRKSLSQQASPVNAQLMDEHYALLPGKDSIYAPPINHMLKRIREQGRHEYAAMNSSVEKALRTLPAALPCDMPMQVSHIHISLCAHRVRAG